MDLFVPTFLSEKLPPDVQVNVTVSPEITPPKVGVPLTVAVVPPL